MKQVKYNSNDNKGYPQNQDVQACKLHKRCNKIWDQ